MSTRPEALRVTLIASDSAFVQVMTTRASRAGWQLRPLSAAVPPDDLLAMRVAAVVVDLAVLGERAWEFVDRVAGDAPAVGIVVCTSGSSVAQRVRGLRLGADDWVTKPCHPEEVIARVEAVVRRRRRAQADVKPPIVAGGLEIRHDRFDAFAGGRPLELTRREFELLALLAAAQGKVLERDEIYERVWGYTMAHGDRSVDVFVRKLRQKLKRLSPEWSYLHTHFGIGYRFQPELRRDASLTAAPGEQARGEARPSSAASYAESGV